MQNWDIYLKLEATTFPKVLHFWDEPAIDKL